MMSSHIEATEPTIHPPSAHGEGEHEERTSTPPEPENVLRNFLATPLKQEANLQEHIQNRLRGEQHPRYLKALQNFSGKWDTTRGPVLAAAIGYELQHRQTMQEIPYFNRGVLMRIVLEVAEHPEMQSYLHDVSLQEMQEVIAAYPQTSHWQASIDQGRLAAFALDRMDDDPDRARSLLDPLVNEIHGKDGKTETVVKNIFERARKYPPRLTQYLIERFQTEDASFTSIFARRLAIADVLPAPLAHFYKEHKRQESEKHEKEQRRIEAADRKRKQEEEKQRREGADTTFDALKENLSRYELDLSASSGVDRLVSESRSGSMDDFPSVALLEHRFLIQIPNFDAGHATSLHFLEKEIDAIRLWSSRDEKEKNTFLVAAETIVQEIRDKLTRCVQERAEPMYLRAEQLLFPNGISTTPHTIDDSLRRIDRFLAHLQELGGTHTATAAELSHRFSQKKKELEAIREEQRRQQEKEILNAETCSRIDSLRQQYAKGTGLDLPKVPGSVLEVEGIHIGSVSVSRGGSGGGLGMRLELTMEMRDLPSHGIFLEMGEDIPSMEKRKAMVDWVAPHEIAHLVDWKLDDITKGMVEEREEEIATIARASGKDSGTVKRMLQQTLQECTIDGLGWRMIRDYGTSNPRDTSEEQRLAAAMRGFSTSMDVCRGIVDRATEEPAKKDYAIILLRMIAVAEQLRDRAVQKHVDITGIEEERAKLVKTFAALNEEVHVVAPAEQVKIIALCKEFFDKAETIQFKKSA